MRILIVRFSSIGDIVLTTPVIRCIKNQVENAEIHYLTKGTFSQLLEPNPHIDKVHILKEDFIGLVKDLKKEQFDLIIDLHNNLRTHRLSLLLSVPYKRVDKENGIKLRMVYLKDRKLRNKHIVDRYLATCTSLSVENDNTGLDYFFPEGFQFNDDLLPASHRSNFICLAIGGQHATKQLPLARLHEICQMLTGPVIIIGGPEDRENGIELAKKSGNVLNMAGETSIAESAWLIQQSHAIITHDTGMMHIAAAMKKDIYSIWGNTVPEFGMTPYLPGANSMQFEKKGLRCRPCSKIGFDKCPKGHFKCMEELDLVPLIDRLNG